MRRCAYPGCQNAAEKRYRCHDCGDYFCAVHIYEVKAYYLCKTHFDEPAFIDPHAEKSSGQILAERSGWLGRLLGRK
jgi:hypothetical protein